jgi:hypothetical protein
MNDNCYLHQRNFIKFLTKLEESGSGIYEMLKEGFGEEAMSRARVFLWTKEFLNGRESVADELRSGRPVKVRTGENIKRIEELVRSDRLREQIRKKKKKKRPKFWLNSRRVHHDNVPAYSSFRVKKFLDKKNISVLEHHPAGRFLPLATSLRSPESRTCSKGSILTTLTWLKVIRRSL